MRSRLRERFDVTLPRFDLMAQLDKVPDGMTLSDVSKRMMVSNGNVTGLVERLVESGHLDRRTSDTDRRVQVIRLTKIGRAEFRKMAAEHETWIADIFGDLPPKDVRELMRLLAKTKSLGAEIRAGAGGVSLERAHRLRGRIQQPGAGSGESRDVRRLGSDAAAYREQHPPRVIRYGPGARNMIDFFAGDGDGPIVVFIHGGYWQAFDGSSFSHLRRRAECPWHRCRDSELRSLSRRHRRSDHRADADGDARTGAARPAAGHQRPFRRRPSRRLYAGDRLARRSIRRCRADLVVAAYSISGLFDLVRWSRPPSTRPCVSTRLRPGPRARCSGMCRAHGSLDAMVGGTESAEYFRQSRTIVEPGARPDSRPVSASFPAPTISPRSRRWPIRLRRWWRGCKQLAGR